MPSMTFPTLSTGPGRLGLPIALVAALGITSPLVAETFVVDVTTDSVDAAPGNGVCSDALGSCSLRAAVLEANALAGADTIELAEARYELSIESCATEAADEEAAYEPTCGDLDVLSDITIQGAGAYRTWIDAEPMRPGVEAHYNSGHFDVAPAGILRLHDVLLLGAANRGSGGSIRNRGGEIRVFDSVIFRNESSFAGGAVDTRGGIARFERTQITGNVAATSSLGGGGIFHSNASLPSGGFSLHLIDTTLFANQAPGGSTPTNDGKGGGLSIGGNAVVALDQVTMAWNVAHGRGGGIYIASNAHSVAIGGSTIASNQADADSDAANGTGNGGGVWSDDTSGITVVNSIFGDNTDSENGVGDCGGTLNTVRNSLMEDRTCTFTGSDNVFNQDPLLRALGDRGGPVLTMGLGSSSPAVDSADTSVCGTNDARGRDRVVGLGCDMGAFESGQEPIFEVKVGIDVADLTPDGSCSGQHPDLGPGGWVCSLRAAIQEANGHFGTTRIELSGSTHHVDLVGGGSDDTGVSGDLDLLGSGTVVVVGEGADETLVLQDGSNRVFDLATGVGRLELRNLAVRGGRKTSDYGGNVAVRSGGELLLSEVLIADGWGADGGGVGALAGTVEIERSTFTDNRALGGQGTDGDGGGLLADGADLTVVNSTFHGNQAIGGGGGIAVLNGNYDLNALTVTGNVADSDGNGTGNGGGLFFLQEEDGSVFGSVLADNADLGGEEPDCSGLTDSEGYNLVGAHTSCGFLSTGDLVGTVGSPLGPQLGSLGYNDGETETREPLAGSPLIDANLDLLDCPAIDQRGASRPVDGDGDSLADCDIGAMERVAPGEVPLFADGFETGDTMAW